LNTRIWRGNVREGEHLEDPGVSERIILKLILEKWNGEHGLDQSDLGLAQAAGCCECGNEPSGFTKCGEFFE
jgi:hypothetical protein